MIRVLLIEDDTDFVFFLSKSLKDDADIKIVKTITSESEALRYIEERRLVDIDAILLDLQLPAQTGDRTVQSLAGLGLLELVRQDYRYDGTIIVLTNSRAADDGRRALTAGCDGYLCKRARAKDIPEMLSELKMALRGGVIMIANEMRHVFMREGISAKEAKLLDLLVDGKSWPEIANELGYGSAKTAANIGDRLFDKLLTAGELERASKENLKKRELAAQVWRKRQRSQS